MPVAQQRLDQLSELAHEWEALVGWTVTIPQWMINELATSTQYVTTTGGYGAIVGAGGTGAVGSGMDLYGFGQYMKAHAGYGGGAYVWTPDQLAAMPWAQYGLGPDAYNSLSVTFRSEYKKLTGQDIPTAALDKAFGSGQKSAQGLLTGGEYAQQLLADPSIQKTYGWVKYGLDYQQFQQQKDQMRSSFGHDLTDQEAVVQLRYFHSAQGSSAGVTSGQPQQQQQKVPGVGGSVIR